MNKTECLSPAFSLQDFGTFSNCFSAWSDSDPDSLIVHVPTNNSFGRVISTCIRAYCRLPKIARENCCAAFNGTEASLALSTLHYVDFQSAYCSNTSLTANPDVAGPGVVLAYDVQLAIAALIWLYMRLHQRAIPAIGGFLVDGFSSVPNQGNQVYEHLKQVLKSHLPIIHYTLVEFQEAQCFFMIAIQIASIVAVSGNANLYGASSLSALTLNIQITRGISPGGIIPITFGLWLIYEANMRSWYMLFCSSLTVSLSIVTFCLSSLWEPKTSHVPSPANYDTDLEECGYNSPPLVWCGNLRRLSSRSSDIIFWMNIPAICVFVLLILLHVGPWVKGILDRNGWYLNALLRRRRFKMTPGGEFALNGLKLCIEYLLAALSIMYPVTCLSTNDYHWDLDFTRWQFGQIIALSIWAPVLYKYSYWTFFGVKAYSAARIPQPYAIVRSGFVKTPPITNNQNSKDSRPNNQDIEANNAACESSELTQLSAVDRPVLRGKVKTM